jgi:glycosyltransferase involved in cell wall biosynthesis
MFWLCRTLAESFDVHVISFAPAEGTAEHPWTDHRATGGIVKPYRYGFVDKALAVIRWTSVHEIVLRGHDRRSFVAGALAALQPDVVLANQLPAASLIPPGLRAVVVLDTHNAEVARLTRKATGKSAPIRWVLRQQISAAARTEAKLIDRSDLVLAVSAADAEAFRRGGAHRVEVVPNGFPTPERLAEPHRAPSTPIRLLFLSSLEYSANRSALRTFVSDWAPALTGSWVLDVVGSGDPGRSIRTLLATDPRIRLVGRVADVQAAYRDHDLLVVPITEGGGTRLKVLEAIGAGLAILSTAVGVEGVGLLDGVHYLRAENGQQAVEQLARVAADPGLVGRLAIAAQDRTSGMDWDSIGQRLSSRLLLLRSFERSRSKSGRWRNGGPPTGT